MGMRGRVENSGVHEGGNQAASSSLAALPCFAEEAEAEEGDWEEAEAEAEAEEERDSSSEEEEQGEEPPAFFFLDLQKKIRKKEKGCLRGSRAAGEGQGW